VNNTFSIRELHQIELSSHCNLRCRYCPSRSLQREKLFMSDEHFVSALKWVRTFRDRGWQDELNLAGIGESTMHPKLVEYVETARDVLGDEFKLVFATNGLLITEELAAALVPHNPIIFVSLHRPEKAGPAIEILKRHNLVAGISADPALSATNWAGQVKWHVSTERRDCHWVRDGRVFMMADGRVSRCAYDASGIGVIGHIDDDHESLRTSPYELCKTCDQDVGVEIGN
jgi:hypothetical protein